MEKQNGMVLAEKRMASGRKNRQSRKGIGRIALLVTGLVLVMGGALCFFTGCQNRQRPADLMDAYIQSMYTFDYGWHFSLFQPEFVEEEFTSKLREKGITYEQGIEQTKREAKKIIPLEKTSCSYDAAQPVELTAEELEAFRMENTTSFSEVGLDVNKIEKAMHCLVENIRW